jgi:hypothetical protein
MAVYPLTQGVGRNTPALNEDSDDDDPNSLPFNDDDDNNDGHCPIICNYKDVHDTSKFVKSVIGKNSLSFLHVNCRSLSKNFAELNNLLSTIGKIKIIALTETWLSPETEHLYNLDGYKFISLSRPDKRGGGCGLLHR